VVDHDHRTGGVDGLCHFGCNRRLHDRLRQYLADPPGRALGLWIAPAKLKAIQDADTAKRKRDRTKPRTNGGPERTSDFHARTRAALEATKQGA